MNDTIRNPQEQLDLITSIVQDSRDALTDSGYPYVIWGGMASIGTALSYLLVYAGLERSIMILWFALVAVAELAVILHYRHAARTGVKYFATRIYNTLWIGIAVGGLGLWVVSMLFHASFGIQNGLATLGVLIGLGYLVSSELTRYRILKLLGFLWMAGGAACLIVPSRFAPAMIGGMSFLLEFIPGLLMYRHEQK